MTSPERISRLLRGHPLWSEAHAQVVDSLATHCRLSEVGTGQIILLAGQPASTIYLLLQGSVRIYFPSVKGASEATIKILRAPANFGEAESIRQTRWCETVKALTACRLLECDARAYYSYLQKDVRACFLHLWDTTYRFAETIRNLKQTGSAEVDQRLIAILLAYAKGFGIQTGEGTLVAYDLTNFDLAEQCGASQRTIIRSLVRLYNKGLLLRRHRRFLIPSEDRLVEETSATPLHEVPGLHHRFRAPWLEQSRR